VSVFVAPEGSLYSGDKPKLLNVHECAPTSDDYPVSSRRDSEVGVSMVRFTVDTEGKVASSEILKSSGYRRLDAQSLRVLKRCRFAPGRTIDGTGVGGTFVVDFTWTLS
jgi:periplasmic protein TonB